MIGKKYGSTVRDDNPNTVIEDGITNNPQPRRPPMLISQPASFSSRRNSDFHFDHPSTFQGQPSFHTKSPYSSRKWDEDSCKYFMEEAANQGGNSGSGTAAEPSRRLKPHSALPPESPKASDVLDEAVLTSLAVSAQPEDVLMTSLSRKPMQFTPPSSTSTSSPDQGDLDDTTKTARWMSRRSTMEGRRDGLNFLNIGGLIKWSAYPEASLPTTAASSSSSSPATSSSSSTPMTSPAATVHPVPFLSAKSADATPVKYNRDLSDARQGKLSTISYGSLTGDEKEIMVEHLAEARPPAKNEHRQSGSGGVDSQAAVLSDKDGHPHLLFDHGRDVVPSEHRNEGSYRKLQPNDTTPAPGFITKKLSIDNLRRRSRDALARLQEGGLGAALSIPTTSGPLSPIILRSIRNNGAGHSLQSDKARSREDLGSLPESHHSQDESLQDLTSGHRLEPYAEESSAVCI
ncbi:hypothetical protein BGX28_002335 [Mortierella sp. GBA30]|nr:hypothetical protein BGX28_002335 [Mortierella sp. GBA30]